jgi:hypothetical protein
MSKRFRVAFSFAGTQREFVAEVAKLLSERFGREQILYDQYHEAEFARHRLGFHLPKLYQEETELIVAVFCKDYESKPWCGLEWDAIHALLMHGQSESVMLIPIKRSSRA